MKITTKKTLLRAVIAAGTFLMLSLYSINGYSQESTGPELAGFIDDGIASPTATGLGKYGSIPVNMATGVPGIDIPVTVIEAGNISLPISLSYHAGGIKVTEEQGPVGMGWSLNAGGVITRVVRGHPDEVQDGDGRSGYFNELNNISNFLGWNETQRNEYLKEIARNKADSEPDIYFYNFAGKSGLFVIDGQGGYLTFPDVTLLITYNHPNSFTITDDDGTRYRFSHTETTKREKHTDTPLPDFPSHMIEPYYGEYFSAWYLTEISHPQQRQKVILKYDDIDNTNPQIVSINSSSFTHKIEKGSECTEGFNFPTSMSQNKVLSFARIDEINIEHLGDTLFTEIKFYYDDNSTAEPLGFLLSDIDVYKRHNTDGTDGLLKTVELQYGNYTGQNEFAMLDRLFISSSDLPPYKFTYYTGAGGGFVNRHQSVDRDFLGFQTSSRGIHTNHLIGKPIDSGQGELDYGEIRAPDLMHSLTGILKEIQYPTGGKTLFEYELNEALIEENSWPIGGLRIKKITDSDGGHGPDNIREYEYGDGSVTTSLARVVTYGYDRTGPRPYHIVNDTECKMYTGSSEPVSPLLGQTVRYDEVNEIINGGEGGIISKTYQWYETGTKDAVFSNSLPKTSRLKNDKNQTIRRTTETHQTIKGPDIATLDGQIHSLLWLRPDLSKVTTQVPGAEDQIYYDYESGIHEMIWAFPVSSSEREYHYEFIEGADCGQNPAPEGCTSTDGEYEESSMVLYSTNYEFENLIHKQPTSIIHTNSTGESTETIYQYANEAEPQMRSLNMLTQPFSSKIIDSNGVVLRNQWLNWGYSNGMWNPLQLLVWDGEIVEE